MSLTRTIAQAQSDQWNSYDIVGTGLTILNPSNYEPMNYAIGSVEPVDISQTFTLKAGETIGLHSATVGDKLWVRFNRKIVNEPLDVIGWVDA